MTADPLVTLWECLHDNWALTGALLSHDGATIADGPTDTIFKTNLTEAGNDYYNGMNLRFTSGVLAGEKGVISDYVGASKQITMTAAFSGAPGVGDEFVITGAADIRFSTGWYDKSVDLPQVTVTESSDLDEPFELGYGTIRVYAIYYVNVWVKILRTTAYGSDIAKTWIWAMRQEVKRILKANLVGLTDLQYVVLDKLGVRRDEPERDLLRWQKAVSVIYEV